ncbi:MAG: membrane protein insertase YidC, partial [Rubrivivax sp.]|nr:membrane protein insertase YidC [Rubrivivax sp.]
MTDIRRTLLWVVFTMSLVLLWDAWNRHTGQPTLFGSPPRATAPAAGTASGAGGPGPAGTPAVGVPQPAAQAGAAVAAAPVAPPSGAAPVPAPELVVISTDVVKATFDSQGGTLVRLEMLNYRDAVDPQRNALLFDRTAKRAYWAQTGLITSQAGVQLPNHLTAMTVAPGERTLATGSNTLSLRFESPAIDGRKLAKTYTFSRGSYTVAVRHEFTNQGEAPVQPQLYLQLARDAAPPEGESSFYFTFTGPALYTEANKFVKLDFKDIAKGSASHDKSANDGWVAMVQHYFASAWLVPAGGAREFRTARVPGNGALEHY